MRLGGVASTAAASQLVSSPSGKVPEINGYQNDASMPGRAINNTKNAALSIILSNDEAALYTISFGRDGITQATK
jgi:hypothetical protein